MMPWYFSAELIIEIVVKSINALENINSEWRNFITVFIYNFFIEDMDTKIQT